MAHDADDIGQDRTYNDAVDKYDANHGKYKDNAENLPEDTKLPTGNMPKAPDPSPFKMGPTGGSSE